MNEMNPPPKHAAAGPLRLDLEHESAQDLLEHWARFSGTERRILEAVSLAIAGSSREIQQEVGQLTTAFQDLAARAEAQTQRVCKLSNFASTLPVGDEQIPMPQITENFNGILSDIVAKIVFLSQHAMSTVYALDGASESLTRVEECVGKVEQVNRRTNMLALNARIEAVRAGEAGKAFGVVADEIRELSRSTAELSSIIKTNMSAVVESIKKGHEALRVVATVDMSDNILAKERLDDIVNALVMRNEQLGETVRDAGADSTEISAHIGQIVCRMQFQDRVSQKLEQVCDTLAVLGDAVLELRREGETYLSQDLHTESAVDVAWLKQLAGRFKLSDMRADFVTRVIEGQDAAAEPPQSTSSDSGSIELF